MTVHTATSILIVEDEVIMAMYLEMMLKREGFVMLESVSTGEEAVVAAEEQKPDVILIDIRLAGDLDGIEAARAICNRQPCAVIFMTGYSDAATRGRAEELHPVGYLTKPFDTNELVKALRGISIPQSV